MTFTDDELLAWLDEQLPVDRMAAIERALRDSDALQRQVAFLAHRRDQGGHTIGEIWRRFRLSCPTRSELGSFLLETLEPTAESYVQFHVQTVGCRFCLAMLDDMRSAPTSDAGQEQRRRRLFESSARLLPNRSDES